MSEFTDDLKRVKEEMTRLENSPSSLPLDEMIFQIDYSEVKALLARLEAAEDLMGIPIGSTSWKEKYEAWSKACGRDK